MLLDKRTGEKRAPHGRWFTYPHMGAPTYKYKIFIYIYIYNVFPTCFILHCFITRLNNIGRADQQTENRHQTRFGNARVATFLAKRIGEKPAPHGRWFTYRRMGAPSYEKINRSHTLTHTDREHHVWNIYIYMKWGNEHLMAVDLRLGAWVSLHMNSIYI